MTKNQYKIVPMGEFRLRIDPDAILPFQRGDIGGVHIGVTVSDGWHAGSRFTTTLYLRAPYRSDGSKLTLEDGGYIRDCAAALGCASAEGGYLVEVVREVAEKTQQHPDGVAFVLECHIENDYEVGTIHLGKFVTADLTFRSTMKMQREG